MAIASENFIIKTRGYTDIVDITSRVQEIIKKEALKEALVTIFVSGSTASVVTMEYEPGLIKDLPEAFEEFAPMKKLYHHDETWEDGNGYAHVRASIVGNSVSIPVSKSVLQLGTWQQIVLIDFDNKPRTRNIVVQIIH